MSEWSGYFALILDGARVTLLLTLIGCAFALVMAFAAGLGRLSRFFAVRALATKELNAANALRVLGKEVLVGVA